MVAMTEQMVSRAGFLARIPLLSGLAESECQALAGRCRVP
jgi:hypothetical protein